MPPGTCVHLPSSPKTDAGRAQNLIATPRDSPYVFDRDVLLDFPNHIRTQLGLDLRNPRKWALGVVGTDGIEYTKFPKYYLLEHKELTTIWHGTSDISEARKRVHEMLMRHLEVARILEPYGCLGFRYSTNLDEMRGLLKEGIDAVLKDAKVPKGWRPLGMR